MALTIRLSVKEAKLIDQLKDIFSEKSSSKALLATGWKVLDQAGEIENLEEKLRAEKKENDKLIQIIYKCEQLLNQERTLTDQLVILRKERKKMLDDLQSFFDTDGT